jgi:Cu-Zn family superoxide dismutase
MKKNDPAPIHAIAVFDQGSVKGTVRFVEDFDEDCIFIDIDIVGLNKNSYHGFHVHESGDMSAKCESMCAHFNPYKRNHGCPGMKERHVGDLGNLITNKYGQAKYTMSDDVIKLRGTKANIIGRGLIIHADPDDCGLGGQPDSLKTGHAGKRIACAVIGYGKENFASAT